MGDELRNYQPTGQQIGVGPLHAERMDAVTCCERPYPSQARAHASPLYHYPACLADFHPETQFHPLISEVLLSQGIYKLSEGAERLRL